VTVTAGLIALVYAIVKAQEWGWGSGRTLGLIAGSLAPLGALVWLQGRTRAPLIRLGIFRVRSLAAANAAMLFVSSGMFAMFFYASLYTPQVLGFDPLQPAWRSCRSPRASCSAPSWPSRACGASASGPCRSPGSPSRPPASRC
jgi:predicted MFS family arabinose efflux permease